MERSSNDAQRDESRASPEPSRPSKRSRKGCPECRKRKIKCDEQQPQCGQCQKRNGQCHLRDSIFKQHVFSPVEDNSINIARPTGTELDHAPAPASISLRGNQEQSDQTIRNEVASNEPPPLAAANDTAQSTHPCPPLSPDPLSNSLFSTIPIAILEHPDSLPVGDQYMNIAAPGIVETTRCSVDSDRPHDTELFPSPQTITNSDAQEPTVESLKDTQQELFLLRHYSEFIAPWMDLLYRYEVFSREVLTLAREHPILRYAACAVAAKQLGQTSDPISVLCGKIQQRIGEKCFRGRPGFIWYGIKYYEKAIQTLVRSITPKDQQTPQTTTQTNNDHASPAVSLSQGDLMVRADGEDPIVRLLGTCILIQYEALSANRDAWSGHLTGFSKLLDLIDDGQLLGRHPIFEQVYPWNKSIMEVKAGFWNFVANDLEQSFVAHRRTRVDTDNLALWRNMGLLIEDDGSLGLFEGQFSLSTTPEHARDKVLSYTLIRLLCKLVDFVAPLRPQDQNQTQDVGSIADPVGDTFLHLESQFDNWCRMLSPSFHADGKFVTEDGPEETEATGLFSHALWFSNDLCSTTMMYYHMARMLLIIYRPLGLISRNSTMDRRTTSFDLLSTFREMEKQLQVHAAEVIAIVQGTPCDAVKLRSIQPLYLAGRSCATMKDRKMLVDMFKNIQSDLGIATGYRIEALLREWGMFYQELGTLQPGLTSEEQLG